MRAIEAAATGAVLAAGVLVLGATAPQHGAFWWSDAPRHALNGVFVKDFFAAMPLSDPVGFATRYYIQYPALTILFYPPLFYVISAPFYALFGVSYATALAVVLVHDFAFAAGMACLARRHVGAWVALSIGLASLAAPGIALWGRQIMLEVPALAFAVWGMVVLRRYADAERPWQLYLGAFLLLCAVYTKITAIFLAPVGAAMLWARFGSGLARRREAWIAAALFAAGLVPIAWLTVAFGEANVASVTGIADAAVARDSLAAYGWYAAQLPGQLWWPLLASAAAWPAWLLLHRRDSGLARADAALLLGWLAVGYLFFSVIDLKEARHSTLILPPLLVVAGLGIERWLGARLAPAAALAVALATGLYTWREAPVPAVEGYAGAASWIAAHAPKGAVVLFSGKRDGSFVFNLRAIPGRGDITTLRADKLLLDVAVRRELGVTQKPFSTDEIGAMLDRDGVSYAVAQSDFWTDLGEMSRLQDVLRSDHFVEVARIPVTANVPTEDKELRIYRNLHEVESGAAVAIDLPIIGRRITGEIGSGR